MTDPAAAERIDLSLRSLVGWVTWLALLSALSSLGVFVAHADDFFMGDDFELIADALAGTSLLEPVATHVRPMVRLHFLLYRLVPSAPFFGTLSVLLHLAASASVFLLVRKTHGPRLALPAALLFASSFLANEAVFWIASASVLYCMLFSCLALWSFVRDRQWQANLFLVLAACSYEMWLVVPVLFLFYYRCRRELIPPFGLAALYIGMHLAVVGGTGTASYGGFSLADLPVRFTIYAFRLISPLAGHPSTLFAIVLLALLAAAALYRPWRLPLTLYGVTAMIFSLSAYVSSRFYYFPSLALILMIVIGLVAKPRALRVMSAMLAVYLALASPWINVLDGRDYAERAALHREVYDELTARIDRLDAGERGIVVNRMGPEPLQELYLQSVGRPKLLFVRKGEAIAGMFYPDDAVRMTLWSRRGRPEQAPCDGLPIEVGPTGRVRSTYCFEVANR